MPELSVRFITTTKANESDPLPPIQVSLFRPDTGASTDPVLFTPTLGDDELADLRWYLEVFSTWPTGPDYERAQRIESRLEEWGRLLLNSVIETTGAARLWQQFSDSAEPNKLVTIDATDPRVLRLPWELLADNSGHLFSRRISVRRRLREEVTTASQRSFELPVRILVVVSRPDGVGFIPPREVSLPLLNALDALGNQVTTEFLYPPTLKALSDRLDDETAPPVHVVHFDGHGVYDDQLGLGYLLFEDDDHQMVRVDSNRLGTLLNNCGVPLIVLNACQSAKQEETNPYASVAARLVRAGAGSVLAMNYSVLVVAARMFVEAFYGSLASGLAVGRAVDRGRRELMADTKRHSLTRHNASGELVEKSVELQDWFLPALYQQSQDPVVFPKTAGASDPQPKTLPRALTEPSFPGGLPGEPLHGFHGRARELLTLERELADHAMVVLHGFGGLGKTALAAEAGRWFYRTGRFPGGAAFVSFEHGGSLQQLCSWVGQAVSGDPDFVLGEGDPVQRIATLLRQTPALVILDNFESVLGREPLMPPEELKAVLDAVWSWGQAGMSARASKTGAWGSRILITTRVTEFNDARFARSKNCAHLELDGLAMPDALELAADILDNLGIDRASIPRMGLVSLMDQLGGHALSLYLVLPHLRNHTPAELIRDFETLLPGFTSGQAKERNESLLVSLEFSLRRLGDETRAALPALGVFQGVCFEDDMLAITGIDPALWQTARVELEAAALVKAETLPGIEPLYMQFHPTLLPYLEKQLSDEQRTALETNYWQRYYGLSNYLYNTDTEHPYQARTIAVHDMPNLRRAFDLVIRGVEAGQVPAEVAVSFAASINRFLDYFGRRRESDALRAQIDRLTVTGDSGLTKADYLRQSQRIDGLLQRGESVQAEQACRDLLALMDAGAAYEAADAEYDRGMTLRNLGLALKAQGRPSQAMPQFQQCFAIFERLGPTSKSAKQMLGSSHTDMADVHKALGQFDEAKREYEAALVIDEELADLRGKGVDLGQLGTLALERGDLAEARQRHTEALHTFRSLGEPEMEAIAWNHLGNVAVKEKNWEEAERCHREAMRIREQIRDLPRLSSTYNQLAIIAEGAGRPDDAEQWWLRSQEIKDQVNPQDDTSLQNLAIFYLERNRFDEARRYAERAVTIVERQDLSVEPWKNYNLMAEIASRQNRTEEVAQWRSKANAARDAFAGTRYEIAPMLARFQPAIAGAASASLGDDEAKVLVEAQFDNFAQGNWQIAEPIRRIWAGERDPDALTAGVDYQDRAIVLAILHRLGVTVPTVIAECMAQAELSLNPKIAEILQNFDPLITDVVMASSGNQPAREKVEGVLESLAQNGWQIAKPIRRIWAGERDPGTLTAGLDGADSAIVLAILHRLGVSVPSGIAAMVAQAESAQDPEIAEVLRNFEPIIADVVAATGGDEPARVKVESMAGTLTENGWQIVDPIRRIWAGERDLAALTADTDYNSAAIIKTILDRLSGQGSPRSASTPAPAEPAPEQDPVARVREQWKDVIPAVVAASEGNAQAVEALSPFFSEMGQQPDWRALIAVLRRIVGGERDAAALLPGLDDTDTIVAGDVLRALGVTLPEPGETSSPEPEPEGISLDQLFNMVKLANSAAAPPGLSEMVHMVTRQMASDPKSPGEVRALGRVLNSIVSGDRMPDLSGLPQPLADAVRDLLQSLT